MSNFRGRPRRFGAGKVLSSLVAAETAVGPYLADWNETHIYNPAWPPHAKFHNGDEHGRRPGRDDPLAAVAGA
jgi:hypothetical protein